MGPLIEITNVPIEIEMKVSHAKLEYTRGTAELEISRDNGGLSIKSRPIRLNIDTFEARNSVVPTPVRSIQQSAEKGRRASAKDSDWRRTGDTVCGRCCGEGRENQHWDSVSPIGGTGAGLGPR